MPPLLRYSAIADWHCVRPAATVGTAVVAVSPDSVPGPANKVALPQPLIDGVKPVGFGVGLGVGGVGLGVVVDSPPEIWNTNIQESPLN